MSLTPTQIHLIKDTWATVIIKSDTAGPAFYEALFTLAPETRPLFQGDTKAQARKLLSLVTVVVTKLNKLDEVIKEMTALGIRHTHYGVKASHFGPLGEALLTTMAKILGDRWTPEVKDAWEKTYHVMANAMIEAMSRKNP